MKCYSLWKGHLAILGGIAVLMIALYLGGQVLLRSFNFGPMLAVQKDIMAQGQFQAAGFNHGVSFRSNSDGFDKRTVTTVTATWNGLPPDDKVLPEKARELAAIVLKDFPEAENSDSLVVQFRWGCNIGIWSSWFTSAYNKTPSAWQEEPVPGTK